MAKAKFDRSKPHVNIGTIGHVDHGKTITICGKEYKLECNALTYVKYKNFFKKVSIFDHFSNFF